MSVDWYNSIALRNGGYRSNAIFTIEGVSPEQIFEEGLVSMLPKFESVLDAGCGHGDFTLKMSKYTKSLIGFDNSSEMIKLAQQLQLESDQVNVVFIEASTKTDLPFTDGQFDLIYDRRGPTSIINHSRILRSGGTIFGIHSGALETVKERLHQNHFVSIEIREFNNSKYIFEDPKEFTTFLSGIPGNPDYSKPAYAEALDLKIKEQTIDGRIEVKEYKYIWKAIKP
ncbi:class I SAM-dependent methyltransferase [Paenibacillus glycinis]|uniref:Methyltransferase domain-containing protein n=1 Tax=Paenibacillus glycinis TaxID=2697035 RepID=A0ABW9XZY9_9BACL|nr:class I SAM-dependent methyltransferase [Paenibacillus glycinis]NBD28189.1 methyltransferase domain-containing protein [Paenibacillus glycinis]